MRPATCDVCGQPLQQPDRGRPRKRHDYCRNEAKREAVKAARTNEALRDSAEGRL